MKEVWKRFFWFQFHNGSIKSYKRHPMSDLAGRAFQFHTGSIKRLSLASGPGDEEPRFNSILVRLKVKTSHLTSEIPQRFNSILVRLKVLLKSTLTMLNLSFNSILVRLKEAWRSCRGQEILRFQFHTGSIKSHPKWMARLRKGFTVSIPYWFD